MRVTRYHVERFVIKVAHTRANEPSCDDCAKLSAQLVEALIAGQAEGEEFQQILVHLEQCIPCAEEFAVLRECVQMELDDSWPTPEELKLRIENSEADSSEEG